MGAEESTRRIPRNLNAEVVRPRNSRTVTSQRSSRPSVSEFSNNPERYPGYVLVLVLATGKMEVMTRLEARTSAAQVKIVSGSSESDRSDNATFFRPSSGEDTILEYLQGRSSGSHLYFDATNGTFGICETADRHRHQREGLIWLP